MRARTNQPTGWNASIQGNYIRYDFRDHDYIYYPHSWTDENGNVFREGYYDENGVHYTNICAANTQTMLTCEFCGSKSLWVWKEGTIPACSSCGAQIKIDKIDAAVGGTGVGKTASRKTWMTVLFVMLGIYVGIPLTSLIFLAPSLFLTGANKLTRQITNPTTKTTIVETQKKPSSVFVEEIGRSCYLDGEDYYDEQTECWFWYNTDVVPGQWQYWYEGISSHYGDYGWMEYDDDEAQWYIETSDGKWEKLPDKYDTSKLWHFKDKNVNELY